MRSLVVRRVTNVTVLVVAVALFLVMDALSSVTLSRSPVLTGWTLLVLIVVLLLYNARKKFPYLPFGTSATWLQIHIYGGLLSFVIFGLHVGWRVPNGVLETILAAGYLTIFFSGLLGWWMSREFARRLTTRGNEVLYARIPRVRERILHNVEKLVLDCLAETDSTAIPEFYVRRLKPFFEVHGNFAGHLAQSSRARKALLGEIANQQRYLNEKESQVLQRIKEYACLKDDLDYQYTHQAVLKYWLFLHIPLSYGLLVWIGWHVIVVHAFSGGIR